MNRRPVIGLCAAVERAAWGAWDDVLVMLPRSYVVAVQRAGGLAVLLPPDPAVEQAPDEVLDFVDGLVLAGGADVDPAAYGAEADPRTTGTCPPRDAFEVALARRALECDVPVLGICRGLQLLNVATGGTLVQHLPDRVGHEQHRPAPGTFVEHEVRVEPRSLAARAVEAERSDVKSHHHQGPDRIGDGLMATGWALPDGSVEALEAPHRRFALGVLWHPEQDERSRVVSALVRAARGADVPRSVPEGGNSRGDDSPAAPAEPPAPGSGSEALAGLPQPDSGPEALSGPPEPGFARAPVGGLGA
jgi:putative glutamine amidotransferase